MHLLKVYSSKCLEGKFRELRLETAFSEIRTSRGHLRCCRAIVRHQPERSIVTIAGNTGHEVAATTNGANMLGPLAPSSPNTDQ